jgi:lipoprotein-releasing system permease protein
VTLVRFLARIFSNHHKPDGFARFTRIVAVSSVALGTMALILALSVLGGYGKLMDETAERLGMPVVVKPLFELEINNARDVIHAIESTPEVEHVEPLLQRQALLRANGSVDGVLLVGMSERRARKLSPLIQRGNLPTGAMPNAVCLGNTLARRLGLDVGDTALLYASSAADVTSSLPVMRPIVVGGIIQTGMDQHDATAVIIADSLLRGWLRLGRHQATAIGFSTSSKESQPTVVEGLRNRLGPAMLIQTTREQYASMEAWIALQREPIPIVLGLITLVAMFAVVAALLIAATEKVRHVAILRTLGATAKTVVLLVLLQSLRVSFGGALWGSALGYLLIWLQQTYGLIALDGAIYFVSVLPVEMSIMPLLIVGGTAVALGVAASLAPIALALRIRPAAVLQFR